MQDFTKGPILKALIGLSVPIVLTNLLHSAYQLTDTFWVGRLGAEAVAAVSLSFPLIFLMITLGGGFALAGTILVSQYKGKGDAKQVNHVAVQTVMLMLIISIIISILGYFIAEPAMKLMGAAPDVLPQSVSYLKISFIGMIFLFTFFVFQSLMRGVGEVKMPLYIVFTTVVLNLFLDPLFINGFGPIEGQGVTGAAIATIFTQGIATLIGMLILLKGSKGIKLVLRGFRFDKPLIKKMFFLGLPSSIEQSMKALGFAIMSFLVATFGTTIVAAYGIGFRVLSFVIIPAFGLSMATSTLVGQNMGAGKPERAQEIGNKSSLIAFSLLLLVGAIFYIFAQPVSAAFIPGDEAVILEATIFVKFLTAAFAFMGLQLTLNGIFSGSGNTKISMIFSLVSLWIFEFPLSYILSKHTDLGERGIWIAVPIAAFLSASVSLIYYRLGKWKNTRIIESEDKKLKDKVLEEVMIEEGV
ncbi:MATE family efflux transporter [Candidatus Peregrinibacteria bacterium CG10_big_fil_rev_8_21_14_0_10_36_19]|nr:MAG: MATE family efflux transporter [Candidatus Peregrinibacteria bacterium CG10_big_fil_rev_8_21_14_0_10_36_19]